MRPDRRRQPIRRSLRPRDARLFASLAAAATFFFFWSPLAAMVYARRPPNEAGASRTSPSLCCRLLTSQTTQSQDYFADGVTEESNH